MSCSFTLIKVVLVLLTLPIAEASSGDANGFAAGCSSAAIDASSQWQPRG